MVSETLGDLTLFWTCMIVVLQLVDWITKNCTFWLFGLLESIVLLEMVLLSLIIPLKNSSRLVSLTYSMVPIKRTVFLLTVYGMKNTVRLIGTLE